MKRFLLKLCCLGALAWPTFISAAPQVVTRERVRRNVVVREEPDSASRALDALDPGERFQLIGEVPGWYQVQLPDRRTGFVSKSWTVIEDESVAAEAAGTYRMHAIDVGTGLAVFLEGPDFTLLYDAGSQDDLAAGAENRVVAYIRAVRPDVRAIDHLVLSHPHKDHLELMPDVFDAFQVRHVWDSGTVNRTRGYCRFLRKVEAEPGVRYHNAIATGGTHEVTFPTGSCSGAVRIPRAEQMSAQPVPLGAGARMAILYRDASQHPDPNENTVVVRFDLGGRRILVAGDAEASRRRDPPSAPPEPRSIEGQLLANSRSELPADLLVVGHHGSKTSSRRVFLDAVGARYFIISSGPYLYSGVKLPDQEVVTELEGRGEVFRTDIDDDACEHSPAKVGVDNDESPGGCNNIVVTIVNGQMAAPRYTAQAD
jgi:competence protein ComEC